MQDLLQSAKTVLPSSLEAEVLLGFVLGTTRSYLHAWPEQSVNVTQQEQFGLLLARRSQGEPLAYLVGTKEFWSLPFTVSSAVLVPRPETEGMVEIALKLMEKESKTIKLLDLGTGSGAIALAIAKERPHWEIIAVDNSMEALAIALQNAKNLSIHNVHLCHSDWFSALSAWKNSFPIIVANPPYLSEEEFLKAPLDLHYEPKKALVSEPDGFQALQQIIQGAPLYLQEKGWLVLEHGCTQKAYVQHLMRTNGFTKIQTLSDLAGLDRISIGQLG